VILLLAISLVLQLKAFAAPPDSPRTSAKSQFCTKRTAVRFIQQKCDEKLSIASITKIMTALVVLENCNLEDNVQIKRERRWIEGSSANIKKPAVYGQTAALRFASCLRQRFRAGTCMPHGRGVSEFAEMMNAKANALGMTILPLKILTGLTSRATIPPRR
jgi:D-alanyl-D-alanine carboxypeptidase